MSLAAVAPAFGSSSSTKDKIHRAATILAWMLIVSLAVGFILRNALHHYLHYDQASFGGFSPQPVALLLHVNGGMVALLTGLGSFGAVIVGQPMRIAFTARSAPVPFACSTIFSLPYCGVGDTMHLDTTWRCNSQY